MATYHLYYLKQGQLIGSEDIEAADDNRAARLAEDLGRGELVEVWNAESRVRIVRPGGARLKALCGQAFCEMEVAPGVG
jgi:hypothetical protein